MNLKKFNKPKKPTIMEIQKSIHQKISNVQEAIGPIAKDSTNPFFKSKYFDINAIVNKLNPILKKEGLTLTQPILNGSVYSVITEIDTNDKVESSLQLPEIADPQKLGSCITYFRRYTLQSLLALEAEDDDGNKASQPTQEGQVSDDNPWLNVFKKGTKDLTPEMTEVYVKMKDGLYNSLSDIRNDWKVSKANAPVIESWFTQLKKTA